MNILEKHYNSSRAELFILYGKWRVGKTELLLRFCQGKKHIYFVADQLPKRILCSYLSKAVNDVIFGEGQVSAVYNTWDDLLKTLVKQAQSE